MVQYNFDEHNIEAYEVRTEVIKNAIDTILASASMNLTVSELARVTGYARNTLKSRGYTSEKLKEIKSLRERSEDSNNKVSDEQQLEDAKICITQLQQEIGFWFSRAASAFEIEQDYKKQVDRARSALDSSKKDVAYLKSEIAILIDERNKLQEIVRELS